MSPGEQGPGSCRRPASPPGGRWERAGSEGLLGAAASQSPGCWSSALLHTLLLIWGPWHEGPGRKIRTFLGLPQCFPEAGLMGGSGKAEAAESSGKAEILPRQLESLGCFQDQWVPLDVAEGGLGQVLGERLLSIL